MSTIKESASDAAVASLIQGLSQTKLKRAESRSASEDEAAESASVGRLLSFADRGLKLDNAETAAEVTAALQADPFDVAAFELSGNTVGIAAAEAIGAVLGRHTATLRRLLWKDTFTGRLKTEIGPALLALTRPLVSPESGTRLVEIDLCDIAFGPNGVVGVTELLASPACFSLRILRMNNEGLGHQGCQFLTRALTLGLDASEAAGMPLRLRLFSAGRNRLENVGARMLAVPLSRMGSLRHLALYQNGIGIHGPDGIEALAAIVSANAGLRTLNLMDNSIKPSGAKLLAEPLRFLPKLVELNLSDCLLLTEGAQTIADTLMDAEFPCLEELHLSGNEVNREAALAVAAAAAGKLRLRRLDLNANQIGPEGIQLIKQHMDAAVHRSTPGDGGAAILASFSDDEGEDDEGDGDGEECEEGEEEEDGAEEDQEGEVEAATAGLTIGGGGTSGNRSLFDDLLPNAGSCNLFGGGVGAKSSSGGSSSVTAFSFKAAAASSCQSSSEGKALFSFKDAIAAEGSSKLGAESGGVAGGGGGELFRPSCLNQAVASVADEATVLELLLAAPATFKLDSLGSDPGPALLRAATRMPASIFAADRCQRLVSAAVALCQAASQSSESATESAAAALLEAALRGAGSGSCWMHAVLTETGLIKSESLRNRRRPCDLARTAPFWRGVGRAISACCGGTNVEPEQLRCLAACLTNLWPTATDAHPGDATAAKQVLIDSLLASA